MNKYKTDSIIATISNPTEENSSKFNVFGFTTTPEVLREAILKTKLPMNITVNYKTGTSVGRVTKLYESTYNGLSSIGAELELDEEYKYVSIGYRIACTEFEPGSTKELDVLDIRVFAAFDVSGYDDVAELQYLED